MHTQTQERATTTLYIYCNIHTTHIYFNIPISYQEFVFSDVGETNYDYFGSDIAISGDGMFMAVGSYLGNPNNLTDAGYVRLYNKSGTSWSMIQQINGTTSYDYFGWSLDLSNDGSVLAVTSYNGAARVYELFGSPSLYTLLAAADDIDAWEVAVSGDGSVAGFTSSNSSIGVRIFERNGGVIQQRGTDILGYGYWSGIGLNYDGTIAIIGDYAWPNFNYIGRIGVFQWKDGNGDGAMQWMQMGSDIIGGATNEYLGLYGSVSITHDGLIVAVGGEGYGGDGLQSRGRVRVYNYEVTKDTWIQSGFDLVGDNAYDAFSIPSLSSDGAYLAVGAYNGTYVKMFERNGSNYEIVEDTFIGEEGGGFGWSIDMSADGSAIAISDWLLNNGTGGAYLYDTFLSSQTEVSSRKCG